MSAQHTSALDQRLDLEGVEQVLTADGRRMPHPLLDPYLNDVSAAQLLAFWRDMVILRRLDSEGVALQRQGQLGLWPPCLGQEAAQLGTARALRPDDFAFTSYREHGVVFARSSDAADLVRVWRGEAGAGYDPAELNMAPMQIIIGAQTLHAVGYAVGILREGGDQVAVSYFGDGATSQGDVSEAMVFAASFGAPAVFVCQNNHWAISEPVSLQAAQPIAARAPGFGIPSLRVDGNDVLACFAAMRWALEHARGGHASGATSSSRGPAFLELVTYRMGPHTTADDPSRYRDEAEVELWARRDPITRLEAHLAASGDLGETERLEAQQAADAAAAALRSACVGMGTREPLTVFDHVYAEPHSGLRRQREEYAAYLAGFEGV